MSKPGRVLNLLVPANLKAALSRLFRGSKVVNMSDYTKWCVEQNCTHGHCPLGCDHPQPADYAGIGEIICGACYFHDGTITKIVPCAPVTCPDALASPGVLFKSHVYAPMPPVKPPAPPMRSIIKGGWTYKEVPYDYGKK